MPTWNHTDPLFPYHKSGLTEMVLTSNSCPIHTILTYHFLITGLVHQKGQLQPIHAQFILCFAKMKGEFQVLFIFIFTPFFFQVFFYQNSIILVHHTLKLFQVYFWWEDGGGPEKDQDFCYWRCFLTTWCRATHQCCLHHHHPLQLALVFQPLWVPSLCFPPCIFSISCFLQSLLQMLSIFFLVCTAYQPSYVLFFQTWLIAPYSLVCHTFWQSLPGTFLFNTVPVHHQK